MIGFILAFNSAQAVTVGFEFGGEPGSNINISPATPYTESGYQFSSSTVGSAVFDSANATKMIGHGTDILGFQESNNITITSISAGTSFSLLSLDLGPLTLASSGMTTVSVVGNLLGGGTLNASFPNLTTASNEVLNWSGLSSVQITGTDDTGFDNVVLVPEPSEAILLTAGIASIVSRRRRKFFASRCQT